MERTLALIKPDAVGRGLVGAILARYEARGLRIVAMDLRTVDADLARSHYVEHAGKLFLDGLIEMITSGPLVAAVLEGERAIAAVRRMHGATDPVDADPGSIRGDYALSMRRNCVHASDSPESSAREVALWFPDLV